ncbi:hypothetical protein [Actinoalloteichus hoggarensis]|uniref:hypothetical protein n=1 Tax=Actinoalloteichus hoggarensis TaxID=1470176 RepID=UPI001C87A951|nr:hypothetical protein [Actinoalloteichus hoggarensis]
MIAAGSDGRAPVAGIECAGAGCVEFGPACAVSAGFVGRGVTPAGFSPAGSALVESSPVESSAVASVPPESNVSLRLGRASTEFVPADAVPTASAPAPTTPVGGAAARSTPLFDVVPCADAADTSWWAALFAAEASQVGGTGTALLSSGAIPRVSDGGIPGAVVG